MSISVTCPGCGKTHSVEEQHAGKKAKCNKCGSGIVIPRSAVDSAPEPVAVAHVAIGGDDAGEPLVSVGDSHDDSPFVDEPDSDWYEPPHPPHFTSKTQLYAVVGGVGLICVLAVVGSAPRTSDAKRPEESEVRSPEPTIIRETVPVELETRIASIEKQVEIVESTLKVLADANQKQLDEQFKYIQTRIDNMDNQPVFVSTEGEGYSIAKTPFASFIVSASEAEPYLDGYKVKLRFGNLTTARFAGAKVAVSWGPNADNPRAWINGRKDKVFSTPKDFLPGQYAEVEVTLTPASASDVKQIMVGITLNSMSLR